MALLIESEDTLEFIRASINFAIERLGDPEVCQAFEAADVGHDEWGVSRRLTEMDRELRQILAKGAEVVARTRPTQRLSPPRRPAG